MLLFSFGWSVLEQKQMYHLASILDTDIACPFFRLIRLHVQRTNILKHSRSTKVYYIYSYFEKGKWNALNPLNRFDVSFVP
jgi:hypothetical protein